VTVVTRVAFDKDVDGFHAVNMGNLAMKGREALFEPCTARGVLELLRRSNVTIRGRNAVVVGRRSLLLLLPDPLISSSSDLLIF